MKKVVRIIAFIMIAALLAGSVQPVSAVSFNSLDANTAVAGASVLLSQYMAANENAAEVLARVLNPAEVNDNESQKVAGESQEAPEEYIYDMPSVGVVTAATYLKIRQAPSTESEVVGSVLNGGEIVAVGEISVDGVLWFKVKTEDADGYASGLFILFGEEAEAYKKSLEPEEEEEQSGLRPMPTTFSIQNDLSGLPLDQASNLRYYANEVKYCLETAYPAAVASGNYTHIYSILVYILEMLQKVADLAGQYGLAATSNQAIADAAVVDAHRVHLCETTNQNGEDYEKEIRENETTAPTEAPTAAPTEASTEAPTDTPSQETSAQPSSTEPSTEASTEAQHQERVTAEGQAIVDYALQFVGWLPYVWGGASLTDGADCSGFCGQVYAHFGYLDQNKANVHVYDSYGLRSVGREVALADIEPGDMICYQGHVAIYIGNGQIVHEPAEGRKCEIGSMYVLPILCVRRLKND